MIHHNLGMAYGLRNKKRLKEWIESKNKQTTYWSRCGPDHVIEQVNHVIILLRSSPVFRWFGRLHEYWSASNLRKYLDSYTLAERGGMPRTDRAVTTCRHPLNRGLGQCITRPLHPSTMLICKEPTRTPPGPWPYGSTGKKPELTQKSMINHHLHTKLFLGN